MPAFGPYVPSDLESEVKIETETCCAEPTTKTGDSLEVSPSLAKQISSAATHPISGRRSPSSPPPVERTHCPGRPPPRPLAVLGRLLVATAAGAASTSRTRSGHEDAPPARDPARTDSRDLRPHGSDVAAPAGDLMRMPSCSPVCRPQVVVLLLFVVAQRTSPISRARRRRRLHLRAF